MNKKLSQYLKGEAINGFRIVSTRTGSHKLINTILSDPAVTNEENASHAAEVGGYCVIYFVDGTASIINCTDPEDPELKDFLIELGTYSNYTII